MTDTWTRDLLDAIDSRDADRFVSFLTEDALFRWGSRPPVTGRDAVRDYVAGFFQGFEALSHEVRESWQVPDRDTRFVEGEVTYTLPGGRRVTLPFLNLFRMEGAQVREYLIYADPSPLAEAAAQE